MLFAASPISLESNTVRAPTVRRSERYTHGTVLRTPPAATRCYVQKMRGSRVRVVLWGSLGLGGKGYMVRVGKKSTGERVDAWIQHNNRTGEPTHCCCCTNNCCCAVPSLLLAPGKTFGPGSRRAGRGADPPYSIGYSHHPGNCAIDGSSVGAMGTRVAVVRVLVLRCMQFPVCFSSPRRTHSGSLLKKPITKHRLGLVYAKPIPNWCIPRMAKISRCLTAI